MNTISELTARLHAALGRNDFPDAEAACGEILRIEPDNLLALNALGAVFYNTARSLEGMKAFERALTSEPDSLVTLTNLGELCRGMGETARAITLLEKARLIAPDNPQVLRSISFAYASARQFVDAKGSFEQAIRVGSRQDDTIEAYARLLYRMGLYEECDAFARRFEPEFSPGHPFPGDMFAKLARALMLIARKAKKMAPEDLGRGAVIVYGVTGRCGTTLIQRLLNVSREILVFGEDMHLGLRLPQDIKSMADTQVQLRDEMEHDRQRLLRGEDFWSPRVYPDLDQYLDIALTGFFASSRFVAASAGTLRNAMRWGIKIPDSEGMRTVMSLLPEARYIFIYRNPFDTARSYKSRQWMHGVEDYRKLGEDWNRRLSDALPIQSGNLLKVRYEDLLTSPASETERIGNFTEITGLKADVFGRKFNTFGHSYNSYVTPSELTKDEVAALADPLRTLASELDYRP